MNVIDFIGGELDGKNLSEFEKVRYIYLETCKLFSFDSRYKFTAGEEFNKKIDLTKVDDYLVICHTYCKHVLLRLIKEFTNAEVSNNYSSNHSYLTYKDRNGIIWRLDAAYSDLTRVKLNLETKGFTSTDAYYREKLLEVDTRLGYQYRTRADYSCFTDIKDFDKFLNDLSRMLDDSPCNRQYSDAIYFIRWLLLGINYPFSDCEAMDRDYNLYALLYSQVAQEFLCLSDYGDSYKIDAIEMGDCKRLVKSLKLADDSIQRYLR